MFMVSQNPSLHFSGLCEELLVFMGRGGLNTGCEEKKGQFSSTWKLMREEKRKTEPWEDKLEGSSAL